MHKNQNGFTQHLVSEIIRHRQIYAKHSELSAGFIPMIVALLIVIAAIIWFVFIRVNNASG